MIRHGKRVNCSLANSWRAGCDALGSPRRHIVFFMNFFDELRRRSPARAISGNADSRTVIYSTIRSQNRTNEGLENC